MVTQYHTVRYNDAKLATININKQTLPPGISGTTININEATLPPGISDNESIVK
jgi:hypothetical protein